MTPPSAGIGCRIGLLRWLIWKIRVRGRFNSLVGWCERCVSGERAVGQARSDQDVLLGAFALSPALVALAMLLFLLASLSLFASSAFAPFAAFSFNIPCVLLRDNLVGLLYASPSCRFLSLSVDVQFDISLGPSIIFTALAVCPPISFANPFSGSSRLARWMSQGLIEQIRA